MDPFQSTHHHFVDPNTLSAFHLWVIQHHIWVVPLVVFFLVVVGTIVGMKLYLWWRFDRFEDSEQRIVRCRRRF
jgi:hypothetical protein